MSKKIKRGGSILLALLWLGSGTASATTFLRLQSTYLGDGWFQYRMSALKDPFFTESYITQLGINFTNQIDYGTGPAGWTNSAWNNAFSSWSPDGAYPSPPYDATFLIRSSETTYKLGIVDTNSYSYGAIVLVSMVLADTYPGSGGSGSYSQNIVGYAKLPCLIPCSPAEAENAATNFVYDLKLLPDINITQLIQTNGSVLGLDFTWDSESTLVLQGSADMSGWTNIAYLWSYPPETIWTTNQALNVYGNYFRVALVADGHISNLPPLNSNLMLAPKALTQTVIAPTPPYVTGCQPVGSKVAVNIASQPNETYEVQAVDSHRRVRETRQVTAQGPSAVANFDALTLPNPVYFQVVTLQ